MDIKHTIKDNYLNEADYKSIKNTMLGRDFPWYFTYTVASLRDKHKFHYYFSHVFFHARGGNHFSFFQDSFPNS